MIYCPKCGTTNRQGSRFCNECGAILPSRTGLRCPMCGKMNPVSNVYCDHCAARLVPLHVEPPAEDQGGEEAERPPIKPLSLPTISFEEEGPAEAREPTEGEETDWLAELRATVEETGGEELPPPVEGVQPAEFSDWLDRMETLEPAPTDEEEPAGPEPEAPEQLREREIAAPVPAADEPAVEPEAEIGEPAAAAEEAPVEPAPEVPDWLAGLEIGEPLPPTGEAPDEPGPEMQEWLSALEIGETPPPTEEAPREPVPEAPDWLARLDIGEPAPPTEEAPEEPGPEAPDWLAGAEIGESAPPTEEAPTEPEPETLDWLTGLEIGEPVPPSEEAPAEPEVPDWLSGLEVGEPAPATEEAPTEPGVPDWLAGVEIEERLPPTDGAPTEPLAPPEIEEGLPLVEPVPDWLAGVEIEGRIPTAKEAPTEPPFPREIAEDVPRVDEVPAEPRAGLAAWLAEGPPAPEQEPAGEPALPVEEAPPLPAQEALPDWVAAVTPGAEAERAPPDLAAGPPEMGLPATEPGLAGLVPAEIPEWLEALRPIPEAAPVAEEPLETEGLLQGLRGTLPPSPVAEMLGRPRLGVPVTSGEAALARAELLQELLGRPAAPARPISREPRRRAGWIAQRIIVALLVVAAIAAPMVSDLSLFGSPSAPAADRLFDAIEQQVETGDAVLVAFEYGPAEADEMDRVADPILSHLLQRGSRLILVSTRPEGPAIAEALLRQLVPDATERGRRVANLGYQPGQGAGVQALLVGLDSFSEISTGMPADEVTPVDQVRTAADTAMTVVLAAQPADLRAWVEQASAFDPDLVVSAGISARVEPLAAPYLDPQAGQLQGRMVAGLTGAAVYEARLGTGGPAAFYLKSLGVAQLAVVGVMLAGAITFLLGGRER